MKNEFTDLLSELMVGDDADLPNRLRNEQKILNDLECINPEIGKWIDDFELDLLIQILNSPDSYFRKHFSSSELSNIEKRREFVREIQGHIKVCDRCGLKVDYDRNWEAEVDIFIDKNRSTLKKTTVASSSKKAAKVAYGNKFRSVGGIKTAKYKN